MTSRKRYHLDRIQVAPSGAHPAAWTFAKKPVRGTEHIYRVIDGNFRSRNEWEFIVRVGERRGTGVEVRPRSTPNLKVWADLPDRSLIFNPATLGSARGKWYCQVALADASGAKSKRVVKAAQRDSLPRWFGEVGQLRHKESVKKTRGTDGDALVMLVASGDHAAMIQRFFATKVWVLHEKFTL